MVPPFFYPQESQGNPACLCKCHPEQGEDNPNREDVAGNKQGLKKTIKDK